MNKDNYTIEMKAVCKAIEQEADALPLIQRLLDLAWDIQFQQNGRVAFLDIAFPVRSASAEDVIIHMYFLGPHSYMPKTSSIK